MKKPKYEVLGHLIQLHRKAAGFNQKQLAEMLKSEDISVTFLSQIERGGKRPKPESLNAIAAALHLARSQTLELFLAADYGSPTQMQLNVDNIMIKTLLAVIEDIPNLQEVISDTAKNILIDQMKQLVRLWGNYSQARTLLYEGQMEMAHVEMDRAQGIQWRLDSATNAYLLDARGEISYRRGHLAIAQDQFAMAHEHARLAGDPMLTGLTTIHLGDIARVDGRWDEALNLYRSAPEIFEQLHNLPNLDQADRNAVTIHLFRGDWTILIPDPAEEKTENVSQGSDGHIQTKNELLLAWAYSLQGNWQKSLGYRENVLKNSMQKNLQVNTMYAHVFLADGLLQTGKLQQAERHYQQSHAFFDQFIAEIEKGYILMGLARVNHAKGPDFWDYAEQLFKKSIEQNQRVNYRARYALSLHYYGKYLADLYQYRDQPQAAQQARQTFIEALEIFTALKSPYYVSKVLLGLMSLSLRESNLELFHRFAEEFDMVNKTNHPQHHKLLCQFYMLFAQEKIKRMALEEAASDFVTAFEHAARFNIFMVQSVRKTLECAVPDLLRAVEKRKVRLFLEKLSQGLYKTTSEPWFCSLYFDIRDSAEWMLQYCRSLLSRLS